MKRGNIVLMSLAIGVMLLVGLFAVSGFARAKPSGALQGGLGLAQPTALPSQGTGGNLAGGAVQDVFVKALGTGLYDNGEVRVKANQPVRLHFSAEPSAGCGKVLVMNDFRVRLASYQGEEKVAEFTPPPGRYEYSCTMRMFVGTLVAE